jgi:hypothetical protein
MIGRLERLFKATKNHGTNQSPLSQRNCRSSIQLVIKKKDSPGWQSSSWENNIPVEAVGATTGTGVVVVVRYVPNETRFANLVFSARRWTATVAGGAHADFHRGNDAAHRGVAIRYMYAFVIVRVIVGSSSIVHSIVPLRWHGVSLGSDRESVRKIRWLIVDRVCLLRTACGWNLCRLDCRETCHEGFKRY